MVIHGVRDKGINVNGLVIGFKVGINSNFCLKKQSDRALSGVLLKKPKLQIGKKAFAKFSEKYPIRSKLH
jgi:hypothetical protein